MITINTLFKTHWTKVLFLIVSFLLVYFIVLGHLDALPLRLWDESRLAVNTYEMALNGNYLVPHYMGQPDMWNTKPPLMIWSQLVFVKLFGANDLSIRLPSAIASLMTCILLMVFAKKYLNSYITGIAAVLVLITSTGYINMHGARSADYDSLVSFFIFAYAISYFLYLKTLKDKYLILFYVLFILACLTKGITGLIILPGLAIMTLIEGKLLTLLKNKNFYLGLLLWAVIVLGYYFLRDHYNPGYLKAVYENELGGRFLSTLEQHNAPFNYYFADLVNDKFVYWFALVPCAILISFYMNKQVRDLTVYAFVLALWFILIISVAKTKLWWYLMPALPFLALVCGIFINHIYELLNEGAKVRHKTLGPVYGFVLLFLIFQAPYRNMLKTTFVPYDPEPEYYALAQYIKDNAHRSDFNDKIISVDFYIGNQPMVAYVHQLKLMGKNIIHKDVSEVMVGDHVITHQKTIKDFLNTKFETVKTKEATWGVEELKIIATK